MKSFKEFLSEELLFEEELFEAADDASKPGGASSDTRGRLHELIVGGLLNGGQHMDRHKAEHPTKPGKFETPEESHDRLRDSIHPEDYKKIVNTARSAHDDIRKQLEVNGHKISYARHTSKHGDTERETNIPATQTQDSSDIYVTTKHPKTGEETKHGISLKTTEKSNKNVPSANPGMEHMGTAARSLYKAHQLKINAMHPALAKLNPAGKKAWGKANPDKLKGIKVENRSLLSSVAAAHAKELQDHMASGNHKHVTDHIRMLLGAHKTPAQLGSNASFRKHTTVQTAKGTQHHTSDPSESHEHILNDHKNISVHYDGGASVHFRHTHPVTGKVTTIVSHTAKLNNQGEPLSVLKSVGKPGSAA